MSSGTKKELFKVRFWGARGTMASMAPNTPRYGGNTACVEVNCGSETLILDAGSGLRLLGDEIMKRVKRSDAAGEKRKRLNLLFTHCHYDHISGLPFFAPFFDPKARIDIWSGHLEGPDKTERMVLNYMRPPFFPVGPEVFSAKLRYRDFEPRDVLRPCPGVKVSTMSLDHHDNCVGFRIDFAGRSVCYITDTTHNPEAIDERIVEFVRGTDLMIYDGTYSDAEFPQFWNFGHSTWEEGMRISQAADVKRYCIFHHRPSRSDAALDRIAAQCKAKFRRSYVAYEGLQLKL